MELYCSSITCALFPDCIGSEFNVLGILQCPDCQEIENGVWRRFENTNIEQDMDQAADEDEQHFVQIIYLCLLHDPGIFMFLSFNVYSS